MATISNAGTDDAPRPVKPAVSRTVSRWLELQCPDCGTLWLAELIQPDQHCTAKSCKTKPLVVPYILNQLEAAKVWLATYGPRPSAQPPATNPPV